MIVPIVVAPVRCMCRDYESNSVDNLVHSGPNMYILLYDPWIPVYDVDYPFASMPANRTILSPLHTLTIHNTAHWYF